MTSPERPIRGEITMTDHRNDPRSANAIPRDALGVVQPPAPITKKVETKRDGLEVVRLTVATGASVPEHHSNVDVVVTVVRGAGTFTVDGVTRRIAPGNVIEMAPRVRHSLHADAELELIVVHARIGTGVAPHCGA
jgi:quercetin dioxygenase-like cupin family protein